MALTLIDSSIWIASERGQIQLADYFEAQADTQFAMSVITASELLHGVHRASVEAKVRREAFVEKLLQEIPVLPFDALSARVHSRLWAQLAQSGISIGAHDLLIAATAIAIDAQILTRDKRSFPQIPDLSIQFL